MPPPFPASKDAGVRPGKKLGEIDERERMKNEGGKEEDSAARSMLLFASRGASLSASPSL